ncbi:MAG: hypothetical protein CO012_01375 [Syntrophobacterales bacterium CG_4_8_14_3_um_filter_49_14]|nr:MAG: hypothetical protein COX52_08065 [Syntrophobacterales bacterium CG23_combo_of_CG06-09_8_20_14_all_48_27]PJC76388.1 MAG: hypothetical protein CO012_01375 [Syntrophobacterales bacterium CG_4_8_14_3_um_filter_49_14]
MAADREHLGGHRSSIVVIGGQGNICCAGFRVDKSNTGPAVLLDLGKDARLCAGPAPSYVGRKLVAVDGAKKLKAGDGSRGAYLEPRRLSGKVEGRNCANIFSLSRYGKG